MSQSKLEDPLEEKMWWSHEKPRRHHSCSFSRKKTVITFEKYQPENDMISQRSDEKMKHTQAARNRDDNDFKKTLDHEINEERKDPTQMKPWHDTGEPHKMKPWHPTGGHTCFWAILFFSAVQIQTEVLQEEKILCLLLLLLRLWGWWDKRRRVHHWISDVLRMCGSSHKRIWIRSTSEWSLRRLLQPNLATYL